MATTTPNFGWDIPQSTDLVKDGATAIAALGNDIDTSMVDLKGGTTGQVLSKASNTDMDFTWVAQDDTNAIQNTIVDAKGDLISATAADTPARLAVGSNGQVLTADSTQSTGLKWATPAASGFFKNPVLNSNFSVWQRGTSFSLAASSAFTYTADRWGMPTGANQACTISRQATGDTTNLPNIQYCIRVQRNSGQTGTGGLTLSQSFETINSIAFSGKQVTISFYARAGANYSPTSSYLQVFLDSGTGTDQNFNTAYTGEVLVVNQNATLTTTWQRFSYTGTVPTNSTELAIAFKMSPTGTASTNDYFEVTGVQLEVGSSATDYYPNGNTYQQELAACQRYYVRCTAVTTGSVITGAYGIAYSTTKIYYNVNLPVTMRAYPTALEYSTLKSSDSINESGITALTRVVGTTQNILIEATATGLTQYRPYYIQADSSASAYLAFTSEL